MAHVPLFWVIEVGLVLAVVLVGGGWARMREQRRHVRAMLRDTFKRRRGRKGARPQQRPADAPGNRPKGRVDQCVTTPDTQTESGRTQEQGSPGGR